MMTHVAIAEAFAGDPLGGNSKKLFARRPGRGGRRGPESLASLDEPEVLEDFLLHDPVGRRLSELLRWSEYKDAYHRGEQLEAIVRDVEQALTSAGHRADTTLVLEQLLAMSRRARDEGLVLGLLADEGRRAGGRRPSSRPPTPPPSERSAWAERGHPPPPAEAHGSGCRGRGVTSGPTQNYADPDLATRRARPGLALAVRVAVAVGPLVLALVVGVVAALTLPPHRVGLPVWLWLLAVVLVTSGVLSVCSRWLRRLAPLSALLRLSLVLPDDVPHRFALARRRWSPEALQSTSGAEGEPSRRLLALVATLAAHDDRTRAHGERVQAYAALIGRELGLSADDVERLSWAALLHDVGKVHVPAEVINKTGRPSDEEWAQLQGHPHHGGELVGPLRGWLGHWLDGVEQHHERFDGKGYPRHLAGHEISLAARIIAVADTYDVITSARAYKKPMSAEQARAEITRCAGEQFDPDVVRALLSVGIAKLRRIAGPATLLAALPVVVAAPAQAASTVGAVAQSVGGHAATAVLAAGVGVTGGVATADLLAAPPGARVLVVQETSATTGATADEVATRSADGTARTSGHDVGEAAVAPQATDPAATALGLLVPSDAPTGVPTGGPTSPASTEPASSDPAAVPAVTPPAVSGSTSSTSSATSAPRASAPSSSGAAASRAPSAAPPAAPSSASGSADQAAGQAARDAQRAAERAAKDQADTAKAAADAADKAAKQATKDAADAAKAAADAAKAAADAADKAAKQAADAADKAAKQAADAAGKLTGGLTSGLSGGLTGSAPAGSSSPSSAPSTGSTSGGGLIGRLVGGTR